MSPGISITHRSTEPLGVPSQIEPFFKMVIEEVRAAKNPFFGRADLNGILARIFERLINGIN